MNKRRLAEQITVGNAIFEGLGETETAEEWADAKTWESAVLTLLDNKYPAMARTKFLSSEPPFPNGAVVMSNDPDSTYTHVRWFLWHRLSMLNTIVRSL